MKEDFIISRSIAFIGGGLAVRDLHVPALKEIGLIKSVVGVATSSSEGSDEAAAWLREQGATSCSPLSVDQILNDPTIDVVLVAVPIALTEGIARRVVEVGKAALVEKPIATSADRALALLNLAHMQNAPLLAGENFRFKPEYSRMNRLAIEGLVGAVKLVFWNDLHFTSSQSKYAKTGWRVDGAHDGGYLIDGGTHIVAGLRQIVGQRVLAVHGLAAQSQGYLSGQADTLLLNLSFEDGSVGHLALGYGVFDPESRHPKIYGESGTLALLDDGIYLINEAGKSLIEPRSSVAGFADEWQLLLASLDSEQARSEVFRLTFESILDLQLIESGLASSKTGQIVELPSISL